MLRMSKLADYAFVILTKMTDQPEENWSAASLANETTLPLPTVAKLMKLLARGRVVDAQRGAAGGYRLARAASTILIVDVIEAVDGPISLTECAGKAVGKKECDCAVPGGCSIRKNWERVNQSIRAALAESSLADLAGSQTGASPA